MRKAIETCFGGFFVIYMLPAGGTRMDTKVSTLVNPVSFVS